MWFNPFVSAKCDMSWRTDITAYSRPGPRGRGNEAAEQAKNQHASDFSSEMLCIVRGHMQWKYNK